MFVGGVLVGSVVIILDVVYLLIDFVSFMISFLVLMFVIRLFFKKFSFGWYRVGERDIGICIVKF